MQTIGILTVCAVVVALWLWMRFRIQVPKPASTEPVVSAVQGFVERMESENEQLVELVATLRQKMDDDALRLGATVDHLLEEHRGLAQRLTILEQERADTVAVRTGPTSREVAAREVPSYLGPKYQQVATRLLRGDDVSTVMQDLMLGRGEVELVARLLESEREAIE